MLIALLYCVLLLHETKAVYELNANDKLRMCNQTLTCHNGAYFNTLTCKCECLENYSGLLCEKYFLCNQRNDTKVCDKINIDDCKLHIFNRLCLNKCNSCSYYKFKDQVKTSIQLNCEKHSCENGGQFDEFYCKCDCFSTYKGQYCEIGPICENEPSDCNQINQIYCDDLNVSYYCPELCDLCGNKTNENESLDTTSTFKNSALINLVQINIFLFNFIFFNYKYIFTF